MVECLSGIRVLHQLPELLEQSGILLLEQRDELHGFLQNVRLLQFAAEGECSLWTIRDPFRLSGFFPFP